MKLPRKDWLLLGGLFAYVLIFFRQINFFPLERFGHWDMVWGDARIMGGMTLLKQALLAGNLPVLDLQGQFGWHVGGDIYSLWCPLNLLVLVLDERWTLVVRCLCFFLLGAVGAFLYLRKMTGNSLLSFGGSLIYLGIPLNYGMFFFISPGFLALMLPLLLLFIHQVVEEPTRKNHLYFALYSVFCTLSGDFNGIPVFFPAVPLYAMYVALCVRKESFPKAVYIGVKVLGIFALCGAFYYMQLFYNLTSLQAALKEMNPVLSPPTSTQFWSFFKKHGSPSLFLPREGSGLLLYFPIGLALPVLLCLGLYPVFKRPEREKTHLIFWLVGIAAVMILAPIVLYSKATMALFPGIARASHGTMRFQTNLIPFYIVLASVLSVSLWMERIRGVWIPLVFLGIVYFVETRTYAHSEVLYSFYDYKFYPSSNFWRIGREGASRDWLLALNCVWMLLLLGMARLGGKKGSLLLAPTAVLCGLLFVSTLNDQLNSQSRGHATRDARYFESFEERKRCMAAHLLQSDPKYRTLFSAALIGGGSPFGYLDTMNWKQVIELEERQSGLGRLFIYRELDLPYAAVLYRAGGAPSEDGSSGGGSSFHPLSTATILARGPQLRWMGVKYVSSADKEILHGDFKFLGSCKTGPRAGGVFKYIGADFSPSHQEQSDIGEVFLYELKSPLGIAFGVPRSEKLEFQAILRELGNPKNVPWEEGVVWLETEEALPAAKDSDYLPPGIVMEPLDRTAQSIRLQTDGKTPFWMVASVAFRPNFRARIDGAATRIHRAYGGLMALSIPAGAHQVRIEYIPYEAYLGLLLTICGVLMSLRLRVRVPGRALP